MRTEVKRVLRMKLPGLLSRRARNATLPHRRVMMFHSGRSGSTVLAELLDQHPEVCWQGEIIHRLFAQLGIRRVRIPPKALLLDSMIDVEAPIVGFEAQYYMIGLHLRSSLPAFVRALRELDFQHTIVLSRSNLLRMVVSNLVAIERNRWSFGIGEPVPMTRIRIDLDQVYDYPGTTLLTVLEAHVRNRRRALRLLSDPLELVYEDDVESDPRIGYRRICEHIGIPPVDVTVTTRRATPYALAEIVENYDDVRAALRGTPFQWMADEAVG